MAVKELLGIREGILSDLHQDHEKVAAMMEAILATNNSNKRSEIFREMKADLSAHAQAESKVLYKKMQKTGDEETRKFAFEGDVEHQMIEELLDQLGRSRAKDTDQWTARFTVLQELVTHHVEEEESEGFESAHREFDREQLEKFGEQFRREKEKLL